MVQKSDLTIKTYPPVVIGKLEGKPAFSTMKIGCAAVEKLGIKYWISSGTLLGIYRDKGLIPHDTDIDICCICDFNDQKVYDMTIELVKVFAALKYRLIVSVIYQNRPMQLAFIDENEVIFDIYFYYSGIKKGYGVNYNMEGYIEKPQKYFLKLGEIEFMGSVFPIPDCLDEFLVWRFGDWKTPALKKVAWQEEATHLRRWV